ncbi:MAG: CDP-glycerol glycerophosphotransferase family protein, partial [Clostridia bacterium]|nr:CDP-glycerol glycerophosphotransferase family protein [Clostridia bacterium]
DLLITDYSSAVFEASLLNIPMLLYAYDLEEYTAERDFYYEFKSFVPGKIVKTQAELINAVNEGDFEKEKIPAFRDKFFTDTDGKSSQRVADKIIEAVNS